MRIRAITWFLPVTLVTLVGCGSGPALLNTPGASDGVVRAQAVSTRPSIRISRGTLSTKKLGQDGGMVVVGATVTLKNLTTDSVTVVVNAVNSKKQVIATQSMILGEADVWRTADPGIPLPPNFGIKNVSYSLNVVVASKETPTLKKSLKAGSVSVAKSSSDPNQPPPPPF